MVWPAVKRAYTQGEFQRRVELLRWTAWRPSRIVLHNTAAPTASQWIASAERDVRAGRTPGAGRIDSLEQYFREGQHWSGCPHLFIAPPCGGETFCRIWEMNSLLSPGVHSPSWNSSSIGIEMIADFARESDESGVGLAVRQQTIFVTALLCSALGLEPTTAVRLHKDDPRTNHDCPGKLFAQDRAEVLAEIAGLLESGDWHGQAATAAIKPQNGTVTASSLNVRSGPGVANSKLGDLARGERVSVVSRASNAGDGWLELAPGGRWVAAKYVKLD